MANQKGIIKLGGTIGDITFYKSKDGYMAREKGGIDAKRFRSDPAFKRTRENAQEFGHSGKMGSLFRRAFRPLIGGGADEKMTARLVKRLMEVVKTDVVNKRGERVVMEGDLKLIEGFDFNVKSSFKNTVFHLYDPIWDRTTGECKIVFSPFIAEETIAAPNGTTHYRFVLGVTSVDFQNEVYELKLDRSVIAPWNEIEVANLELTTSLTPNSTQPVFIALSVEFYQEVNGANYLLNNGSYNATSVIKIDPA